MKDLIPTNQPTKAPNSQKKNNQPTTHPTISQTEKKTPKCIQKIPYQFKPLKRVLLKSFIVTCEIFNYKKLKSGADGRLCHVFAINTLTFCLHVQ